MKKMRNLIRAHPARFYLALFTLMILPALSLYPLAASDHRVGIGIALGLIIFANAAALLS